MSHLTYIAKISPELIGFKINNDTNLFEIISNTPCGVVTVNCHLWHKLHKLKSVSQTQ